MKTKRFAFEELGVWKKAIDFAVAVIKTVDDISTDRKHFRLLEQIEASVTGISMNIAEGKGRYSKKEFVHYLYIARGSLYETITLLVIFVQIGWITDARYRELESDGIEIASMLMGLIKSLENRTGK